MQECEIGLVRIRRGTNRLSFAAPELRRSGPLENDVLERVIEGLHLAPDAIVAANWVDNGPGWLAVLLRSRDDVLALRPNYVTLSGLRVGAVGPWNSAKDGSDAQFEVRAFTAGGYEDPVTGSLNAGIAQWLIGTGIAPSTYIASQGTALGRSGRVHVERDGREIWIGGAVTTCIVSGCLRCCALLAHGVENPALYNLMFGGYLGGPDRNRPAVELAAAEKTKSLLADVIVAGGLGRAIPHTERNERQIAGAILACWSLVHGLTLLLADGLVGPKKKSAALGDRLVQELDGLAAELPVLPPGTWMGPQGS